MNSDIGYVVAAAFNGVIAELTERPLRFENNNIKTLREHGLYDAFISLYTGSGLRENYWSQKLTSTEYTLGYKQLAGWTSCADRARAQGKYSYGNDMCENWMSDDEMV